MQKRAAFLRENCGGPVRNGWARKFASQRASSVPLSSSSPLHSGKTGELTSHPWRFRVIMQLPVIWRRLSMLLMLGLLGEVNAGAPSAPALNLMPLPASVQSGSGEFNIDAHF